MCFILKILRDDYINISSYIILFKLVCIYRKLIRTAQAVLKLLFTWGWKLNHAAIISTTPQTETLTVYIIRSISVPMLFCIKLYIHSKYSIMFNEVWNFEFIGTSALSIMAADLHPISDGLSSFHTHEINIELGLGRTVAAVVCACRPPVDDKIEITRIVAESSCRRNAYCRDVAPFYPALESRLFGCIWRH